MTKNTLKDVQRKYKKSLKIQKNTMIGRNSVSPSKTQLNVLRVSGVVIQMNRKLKWIDLSMNWW